jgi:methionine--tRNA ligase beta chain
MATKKSALQLIDDMIFELEQVVTSSNNNNTASATSTPITAEQTKAGTATKDKGDKTTKKAKETSGKTSEASIPSVVANDLGIDAIEFKVGIITQVQRHETAEKLYCEMIDVGEAEPRPIASGLVGHYSLEEMLGRRVVVVCNLSPRKLQGFKSHGMVLCAMSHDNTVIEFLSPPENSKPGDRISAEGYFSDPLSVKQCDKQDAWKKLAPLLTVKQGQGYWNGIRLVTSAGESCTTSKVLEGILS